MKTLFYFFGFLLIFLPHRSFSQGNWIITDYNGKKGVQSGNAYYFKETNQDWHLKYLSRSYGINLGWGKEKKPNIKIVKEGGGQIKCGDKVALSLASGGYLKYQSRRWGINLVWSKRPVYQFEIRSSTNVKGDLIQTESTVGIYNSVEDDFLINCKRIGMPVVDLAWFADCSDGVRLPGSIPTVQDHLRNVIKYGGPLIF